MGIELSKIILCGGLYLLTLLTGVWVSRLGRPLNGVVFTIHKLAALAAVAVIGANAWQLVRAGSLSGAPGLGIITALVLLLLALFVSGALLSFERPVMRVVLRVHQAAPLLALAALAAVVYLAPVAVQAIR